MMRSGRLRWRALRRMYVIPQCRCIRRSVKAEATYRAGSGRLIIARALALNPKLLLDEATSALDNRTQAIVSESLDRLNVTRVVVAHRLSTIRNADRIYVIKAGRVVQVGSFDELAKQPGVFAELIKRQLA